MRDAGTVSEIVDPTPIIEEKLSALAAEHEPRLKSFDAAIANAKPSDRRHLKRERRREVRAYHSARRKVQRLSRSPVAW
jgi:hypothetical protein